jgi:hypothetical protein
MLSRLPPSVDAGVAALADLALLLPLPLVVVVALLALPLLLKAYSGLRRVEWWVIRRLQLPPPSRTSLSWMWGGGTGTGRMLG